MGASATSMLPSLPTLLFYLRYHLLSELIVLAIAIAILVHYRGSRKNLALALHFRELLSPHLSRWFRSYDGELVLEAPNIMKLYPSHRDSCLFAIVSFALVQRHQIISFLLNPLFFRLRDELVVEIPVNSENPVSLTAAIVRRQQIRSITKKDFPDVKQLCKEYKPILGDEQAAAKLNVPASHCILVERAEHVRHFLYSEKEAAVWRRHGRSVRLVYLSDVNKYSRYPMAVRMVLNLNADDVVPMLEWLIGFVDRVAKLRMTVGERKEALKKREALQIHY
jgi:hypothetical protein